MVLAEDDVTFTHIVFYVSVLQKILLPYIQGIRFCILQTFLMDPTVQSLHAL